MMLGEASGILTEDKNDPMDSSYHNNGFFDHGRVSANNTAATTLRHNPAFNNWRLRMRNFAHSPNWKSIGIANFTSSDRTIPSGLGRRRTGHKATTIMGALGMRWHWKIMRPV